MGWPWLSLASADPIGLSKVKGSPSGLVAALASISDVHWSGSLALSPLCSAKQSVSQLLADTSFLPAVSNKRSVVTLTF